MEYQDQILILTTSGEIIKIPKVRLTTGNLSKKIKTTNDSTKPYFFFEDNKVHYDYDDDDDDDDDNHSYSKKVIKLERVMNNNRLAVESDYMPENVINCFNTNCLAEIFMYLPACERPKLALVCKNWKRILDDSWFKVKKLELIYWQYDEYPSCLAKYPTSDGGFCLIKSLLNKCGRYLTTLDLTAYGDCKIVPVINELCPNLVTLRLRFTNMDQAILANSFTRLSKLKSLTIIFQNIKIFLLLPLVALINSLRNVANTLTDLNLLNWLDELKSSPDFTEVINNVIRDLKALKRFESAGVGISADIYDYLTANGIICSNHTPHLKNTLSISEPFINIKLLNMMQCLITDDTLYTIANTFKHLELLHFNCNRVTDNGVVALSKMNNLQNLFIYGRSKITDSSVILLKNLIKLGLPISNKITDDSVLTVLKNSPKMDVVSVYRANVTAELVKKAAEISNNRKRRLIFCAPPMPDIQQYASPYFDLRIEQIINGKPTPVSVGASAHAGGAGSQRVQGQLLKCKSCERVFSFSNSFKIYYLDFELYEIPLIQYNNHRLRKKKLIA